MVFLCKLHRINSLCGINARERGFAVRLYVGEHISQPLNVLAVKPILDFGASVRFLQVVGRSVKQNVQRFSLVQVGFINIRNRDMLKANAACYKVPLVSAQYLAALIGVYRE